MLDALVRVRLHLALERLGPDHLADILVHKRVSVVRSEADVSVALGSGAECETYAGMSPAARTPNPFFSVLTISIGAYCLFWKLCIVNNG